MSFALDGMRAMTARFRSRKGATRSMRRTGTAATALVAGGIVLSLASAGGTTALWTGSVSITAPSIRSGSITALLSGFTGLSTTFTSGSLTKTSYIQVGNSGVTNAQYSAQLGLGAGSASTLAGTTTVTLWPSYDAASCTETAVPSYAATYAWNAVPVFTGSLPAGTSGFYCLRSRTAASNLTTTASITPQITVTLTLPNTGWSSTATASATETVVPDPAVVGSEYTDAVRADGATDYWRLGEASGSIFYDLVGGDDAYAGSGTTRGIAGALSGDTNTATTFSGDANGTAGTRNLIAGPQSFAVEAWFKTTSTTGGKIVGFGSSSTGLSGSYDRHVYLDAAGHVVWGVWPGYSSTVTTSGVYNDGQWHHVVGNLSASGQQLYVDGALIGTTSVTSAQAYTGYWRIGGDSPWAGDAYFDGTIDEVAVYSGPLSSRAVANHYNLSGRGAYPASVGDPYGSTVYADAPTLYWRLGDSTASTAADSSGNAHPGAYSGAVTTGAAGAVPGTRNTAASFGGGNGLVASTQLFSNPQNYSIEAWFSTTSTTGGKLVGFGNSQSGTSSNYDRHVYLQNDGKVVFGTYPGSIQTVATPSAYNDGLWHHVVATQSAAGMQLYVDGQYIGSNSATTPQNYDGYWRVGGDNLNSWTNAPTSQYVTAKIDEVAIYGAALSSAQIKRHYSVATGTPAAAFTGTTSSLTASLDGSASSDYDGAIAGWSWNFGDGTAAGTGATVAHTYASPGTYTATLTVTDNAGRTDTAKRSFSVADTTAPTVPGTPVVASNTGTTVSLTWPASTDDVAVSGYDVYRNGAFVTTTATNSYTDTGRTLGTAYTYAVKARDASGNISAASATTSVTTYAVNTAAWYQVKGVNSLKCLTTSGTASPSSLQLYPCASPAGTTQTYRFAPASTGGYFTVIPANATTLAWDVNTAGSTDGLEVYAYSQHGGSNQQWLPTRQSDGSYTFTALNSGKCLDVPNNLTTDGTKMQQYTCSANNTAQMFTLVVAP
ncbi:LamG-like jellyroll fold domain-containing protein [Naasia aerilata]|uniref:PKD domain-containing protein n=1 Tax=Naasia aerilata TaxID=1162966 RepID=A0ABM8GCW0_9MICO|nr:LamG-like jellyroll fold domain-containing protein [Naasia aerilata]BDZ46069.1 hypothetical protein GCM10025866_19780 [Naasia aerilata]